MSYGNPKPTNPATKFIEFKGDTGIFRYWDKETSSNIEIPMPVKFIVVEELATIAGFNDANLTGVYSNEVRNVSKEKLSVRLFPKKGGKNLSGYGLIGLYSEIKGDIKSLGGKFAKSVYALTVIDGKSELVNIKVFGSFLNAWIESGINTDREGLLIRETQAKKKGKNDYFQPVIETFQPDNPEKAQQLAKNYYKLLHEYFDARKSFYDEEEVIQEENAETIPVDETAETDDGSELPF